MKNLILTTIAALVALLLTGSAIYAQTDDWMKGVFPPGFFAIADCSTSKREVSSFAQNNHAAANFTICWEGRMTYCSSGSAR
jgi:hypothetical protein